MVDPENRLIGLCSYCIWEQGLNSKCGFRYSIECNMNTLINNIQICIYYSVRVCNLTIFGPNQANNNNFNRIEL